MTRVSEAEGLAPQGDMPQRLRRDVLLASEKLNNQVDMQWLTIQSRIRRVKCDETKPACNRCTSTQRKCDGYLVQNTGEAKSSTKPESLRPSLNIDVSSDALEKRTFDFFRARTVPVSRMDQPHRVYADLVNSLSLDIFKITYGTRQCYKSAILNLQFVTLLTPSLPSMKKTFFDGLLSARSAKDSPPIPTSAPASLLYNIPRLLLAYQNFLLRSKCP